MRLHQTSWPKRLFDILLSVVGLLASAPLSLLIAISIKLEDDGPVFYSQERIGKGCTKFKIWKFRSMAVDSGSTQIPALEKRVTAVGRIIRSTALDELPQLWNILKGDMSFVGPRPLVPEETDATYSDEIVPIDRIPGYEARHQITPGLTGLAQIFASREMPRRQKFRLDLLYIKKRRFLVDIWFIVLSFWIALRGQCEYPGRKIGGRVPGPAVLANASIRLHTAQRTGDTWAAGAVQGP